MNPELIESASVIYELVTHWAPELSDKDEETQQACINAAFTKGVNVIQIITGIDHKEAVESLSEACERESNTRNAEYIKRQMGWEEK